MDQIQEKKAPKKDKENFDPSHENFLRKEHDVEEAIER